MRITFLTLLYLVTTFTIRAQPYQLIDEIITDIHLDRTVSLRDAYNVFYKDELFIVLAEKNADTSGTLLIYHVDINTGKSLDSYKIKNVPDYFMVKDCVVNERYFVLVGSDSYYFFEMKDFDNTLIHFPPAHQKFFDAAEMLTDSLVVLYKLYNFHPSDGKAGLHLHLLNLNSNTLEKYKFIDYPSILLSHMQATWISALNGKLYCISPLTGMILVLNRDFSEVMIDSSFANTTNILGGNEVHERYFDSVFSFEKSRLSRDTNGELHNDNLRQQMRSEVYSKEYIWNTIKFVRSTLNFVEKIVAVNDTVICISISRPEFSLTYREVYFYNVATKKVENYFSRWQINKTDSVSRREHFFTLNLMKPNSNYPYFQNPYIFDVTYFNTRLFRPGSKDELSKFLLKDALKNHYTVRILKYKLQDE